MKQSWIDINIGDFAFSGNGEQAWLAEQLDKALAFRGRSGEGSAWLTSIRADKSAFGNGIGDFYTTHVGADGALTITKT